MKPFVGPLIVGILSLAHLIRSFYFHSELVTWDEVDYANSVGLILKFGLVDFFTRPDLLGSLDGRPPLPSLLFALFGSIKGAKVFNIFVSSALYPLGYLISKKWYDEKAAILFSLFLFTDLAFFHHTNTLMVENITTIFLFLSLFTFRKNHFFYLFLSCLLLSRETGAIYFLGFFILEIKNLKGWWKFALSALPLFTYYIWTHQVTHEVFNYSGSSSFSGSLIGNMFGHLGYMFQGSKWMKIIQAISLPTAAYCLFKFRKEKEVLVFGLCALAGLAVFSLYPYPKERLYITSFIVLYLVLSSMLKINLKGGAALALIFLSLKLPSLLPDYKGFKSDLVGIHKRAYEEKVNELNQFLETLPEEKSLTGPWPVFEYYSHPNFGYPNYFKVLLPGDSMERVDYVIMAKRSNQHELEILKKQFPAGQSIFNNEEFEVLLIRN